MTDDHEYDAWVEEMEQQCGSDITFGPAHDPYGATCDLPHENHPRDERGRLLHEGPNGLTEGRIKWTGGGYAAGDSLPFHIVEGM